MPSNRFRRRILLGGKASYILFDDFNRADGSLGSTPLGQAYSVVSGTWSIASGTARCDNTNNAVVLFGATMADGFISMRTRTTNTAAAGQILFRYVDSNNYLVVRRGTGGVIIGKTDGGLPVTLATMSTGMTVNVWDELQVHFYGNQIDLYLNGILTTQWTLSGGDATKFSNSNTGIGLQRSGATAATVEYDDVFVNL